MENVISVGDLVYYVSQYGNGTMLGMIVQEAEIDLLSQHLDFKYCVEWLDNGKFAINGSREWCSARETLELRKNYLDLHERFKTR